MVSVNRPIHILAFGIAKEIVGGASFTVELPEGATVKDLTNVLETRFPGLRQLASYRIAVNNEFADAGQIMQEGDEVAIIPPVSGG